MTRLTRLTKYTDYRLRVDARILVLLPKYSASTKAGLSTVPAAAGNRPAPVAAPEIIVSLPVSRRVVILKPSSATCFSLANLH